MSQLFRRKLVNADLEDSGLKKCLSAFDLTLLGVGAIIGTGIFVLTGHAAADYVNWFHERSHAAPEAALQARRCAQITP